MGKQVAAGIFTKWDGCTLKIAYKSKVKTFCKERNDIE